MDLYNQQHYKNAAHDAMILVEKSMKEKGKIDTLYGRKLIQKLFSKNQSFYLKVPLGDDLQDQAKEYFEGVFSYYRNYVAHDGSKIDSIASFRILIIASELLEMIDSYELTLTELGGPEEIVKAGSFGSIEKLKSVLLMLDHYMMPEQIYDGLFDDLANSGYGDNHLSSLISFNLIEMRSGFINNSDNSLEKHEWFILGEVGKQFLSQS